MNEIATLVFVVLVIFFLFESSTKKKDHKKDGDRKNDDRKSDDRRK